MQSKAGPLSPTAKKKLFSTETGPLSPVQKKKLVGSPSAPLSSGKKKGIGEQSTEVETRFRKVSKEYEARGLKDVIVDNV